MILLDGSCHDPTYTDTVTPHDKILFLAFTILEGGLHRLTIGRAQLKNMAHLNAFWQIECPATGGT